MKHTYGRKALAGIMCLFLCCATAAQAEMNKQHNPLIEPQPLTYITPAQNIKNVLLLGIDKNDRSSSKGYDYHTDAIMVVAVNLDENKVDLVSLPRDTLTYVPGIRGIYKLNAAINCGGGKTEEGFQKVCEAAAWVMGGIRIDYYCAVDMKAMEAIGDAIGGVDFDLETPVEGYHSGRQHLDGKGIVAYLRSRTGAKVNANDIGRTGRQRELMWAIYDKIMRDKSLIPKLLLETQSLEKAFFTNMSLPDMMTFVQVAVKLDTAKVGSHVITGKYRTALQNWNFTFTDQAHRQEVIRQVYGVQVPELSYVSFEYTKWLVDHGFSVVHCLGVAKQLLEEVAAQNPSAMSTVQREALEAAQLAYGMTVDAFDVAADSMAPEDTRNMESRAKELRKQGDALLALFGGTRKLSWYSGKYWYADRMINEIDVNFR